jgi:hypothetical protein
MTDDVGFSSVGRDDSRQGIGKLRFTLLEFRAQRLDYALVRHGLDVLPAAAETVHRRTSISLAPRLVV